MQKHPFFILILFALGSPAFGQDFLQINTAQRCIYHGNEMPKELYSFEPSDSIEQLKDEILQKTGYPQNFEFLCANVPSVVAVVDKGKRYVLYSRKFFNTQPDRSVRLALLAHEIGHHVNEHNLLGGKPDEGEEMEADEFMGYALFWCVVSESEAERIAERLTLASGIDNSDRRKDIVRGFDKAAASLYNSEHLGWDENDIKEVIKNFPKFPFPVPKSSAEAYLDEYFASCSTLYDVDKKLRKALNATGYNTRRYFYVPDGFALVVRMEQFNRDGTCKGEAARWSSKIVRCEDFSVSCYLDALLTSQPGYFRTFVFVVTPHTLTNNARGVTQKEAGSWTEEGANKLPPAIGNLPFDKKNTSVTALIYEFKVRESDGGKVTNTPSEVGDGLEHLRKSKIINFLRN